MIEEHVKESFVARIWLEHGDDGDTVWRGHIRHIQGEEKKYFHDLMEMREFLSEVTGVSGPPLTAQPLKSVPKADSGTVKNPEK